MMKTNIPRLRIKKPLFVFAAGIYSDDSKPIFGKNNARLDHLMGKGDISTERML